MSFEVIAERLFEPMTAPFDGPSPAGEDLRTDITPQSLYSSLRDARSAARAAERLADNDPASGPAPLDGWKSVERLAKEALGSRSKDVEIACWLTESLTRLRGLDGFSDGVDIIRTLIAEFWDDGLLPAPDEEDPEGRLIAISGLSGQDRDGSLLPPLRNTVLFEREASGPVTLWHYERSREFAALGDQAAKQTRATTAIVPFAELEVGARHGGRESLVIVGRAATRALASWQALEAVCTRVATGEAAPATVRVRNVLDTIVKIALRYVPAEEAVVSAEPDMASGAVSQHGAAGQTRSIVPATRAALLAEGLRIAHAFRVSEPGSPFSYTLEEAVRRARLSWPELLREMLPEHPPRASVLSNLGIRPPED